MWIILSRMKRITLCTATAISLVGATIANAQEASGSREFTPSSAWVIDHAEKSCILKRDFQNGDDTVSLEFHQYGPWMPVTIVVASSTLKKARNKSTSQVNSANSIDTIFVASYGEAITNENAEGKVVMRDGRPFPTKKYQVDLNMDSLSGTLFKAYLAAPPSTEKTFPEGAKTSVIATNVFNENIAMITGSLMAPITSLVKCSTEIPALWAPNMTAPENLEKWPKVLGPTGYPAKWVRNGWQGTIDYWLVVDETGKGLNCIVDPMSSAPREMQMEFCDNLPSSGHTPALNKDGQTVKAAGFNSLTFAFN